MSEGQKRAATKRKRSKKQGVGGKPTVVKSPTELAFELLKERVSPEAKRHKLEYDKKYESSPERVKYREELNRERRRRGIYGHGGPDMSHTKDHTMVAEEHRQEIARRTSDQRRQHDFRWQARGLHEPDGESTQRDSEKSFSEIS